MVALFMAVVPLVALALVILVPVLYVVHVGRAEQQRGQTLEEAVRADIAWLEKHPDRLPWLLQRGRNGEGGAGSPRQGPGPGRGTGHPIP